MTPRRAFAGLAMWLIAGAALAEPWAAPGDLALRHDIQLLADAGVLRGPVTTWPLSWPEIAHDVVSASAENLDEATAAALYNVQRLARAADSLGYQGSGYGVAGVHDPTPLRTFENTPRDQAEVTLRTGWMGDYVALHLQGAWISQPADGRAFRPDGSYVGVNIGNFMISAGYVDRWWGPGWEGSLILSNNARPMPMLTLERNYTDPFRTKLLSWLGPWRASIAVGESDEDDAAVKKVRLMAARVNFKPRPWLEFGLSRTAQWCGEGRPCGWKSFRDMLIGRDNEVDNGDVSLQPGNQMAGYDARLRSPWQRIPLAFYTQWIGEDEAGGFPSKFVGLFGLEAWRSTSWGSLRVHAEYADTACSFPRQHPEFQCAYRNAIFPQGYTYRGRILGHAMDNDSRMYSLGVILTRVDGQSFVATVRRVDLNRDGGDHSISTVPLALDNVELRYARAYRLGTLNIGLGYDNESGAATRDSRARGFLTWQQGLQ